MYEISLSPGAQKSLRNLSGEQKKRVTAALDLLANDPFPKGKKIKKLVGVTGGWRLRVGSLRILYILEENMIKIYSIKKRGDIH